MGPRPTTRRQVLCLTGGAIATALAGCTGDDGGATPTDRPGSTVTVGPDQALRFDPEDLAVDVDATVTWSWASGGHSVTPDRIPGESDWGGTGSTTHAAGFTHSHTFEAAGRYHYYCQPHRGAGMTGTLTVGEPATPTESERVS